MGTLLALLDETVILKTKNTRLNCLIREKSQFLRYGSLLNLSYAACKMHFPRNTSLVALLYSGFISYQYTKIKPYADVSKMNNNRTILLFFIETTCITAVRDSLGLNLYKSPITWISSYLCLQRFSSIFEPKVPLGCKHFLFWYDTRFWHDTRFRFPDFKPFFILDICKQVLWQTVKINNNCHTRLPIPYTVSSSLLQDKCSNLYDNFFSNVRNTKNIAVM